MSSFPRIGSFEAFAYFGGQIPSEPSPPSLRRTLYVYSPGYAGVFPAFTVGAADVGTFNLSPWLNPGETVDAVSISLAVMNTDGTTDPDPDSRQVSFPTIEGALISQRYGNFQADVDYIQYRVTVSATTSQVNTIVFWAYLPVYAPVA